MEACKMMLWKDIFLCSGNIVGLNARKPVFEVSDKARFKPVSLAAETSLKIEYWLAASLDMILCNKQITKALISQCGCQSWSVSCCLQTPKDRFFSRQDSCHNTKFSL